MAQNQVYLIKSGENSFVEETQAIVGISGGKVGIGTTHPEADLHVTGSVKVGGDLTVDGTLTTINSSTVSVDDKNIELGGTDNPTDVTAEGGGITVKGDTDKTFNWHADGGWTSSENLSVANGKHFAGDELRAIDAGGLRLFDNNASGVTVKSGKVGVHSVSPVYDLDVVGSGNFTSLYVGGNSVLTGTAADLGKWSDGSAGEIYYNGGNVGIATNDPAYTLDVSGSGNFASLYVGGSQVLTSSDGGLGKWTEGSTAGEIYYTGGNVGIATNDPAYTLDVAGGGNFNSLTVQGNNVLTGSAADLGKWEDAETAGEIYYAGGNVGINTNNPSTTLDVNGSLNVEGSFTVLDQFNFGSNGAVGGFAPAAVDDIIKWNGTKWVAGANPGGAGAGGGEVPSALINSLISGQSVQSIAFLDTYDTAPRIATELEIDGEGSIIPYVISGVSTTGYNLIFSQEIPNNNYKIHTVFGGKDVYWETGASNSLAYNDGDVSLQRNLTVGGNLTVNGTQTIVNTETVEIEDHNLVIAANAGHNQLTAEYPGAGGAYAGILWGTGDAGAASPVSLTYQSNKGFAFEGGNVGIGITDPSASLHVDSSLDGPIFDSGGTGNTNHALLVRDSAKNQLLRVNNSGNVGIGTTNPVAKLDIFRNTVGGYLGLRLTNPNTNAGFITGTEMHMDVGSSGQVKLIATNASAADATSGELAIHTTSSGSTAEAMRIDSAGNVGIGTTSPLCKFHVRSGDETLFYIDGETTYESARFTSTAGGRSISLLSSASTTSNYIGSLDTNHSLRFFTTKTSDSSRNTHMTITEGGNVGIGTTSPTNGKLEIHNPTTTVATTDSVDLAITQNASGTSSKVQLRAGVTSGDDPYFSIRTRNRNDASSEPGVVKERMRIDSTGNVGIGTANPGAKLEIAGGGTGVWLKTNNLTNRTSNTMAGQNYINLTDQLPTDENSFEIGPGYINLNRDDNVPINQLSFGMNGTLGAAIEVGGGTPAVPNNQYSLRFKVGRDNTDNKAGIERMRISSVGNVGIGTTNPGAKLDIYTTGASAWGLKVRTDNGDADSIKLVGGGGDTDVKFVVKGSGNVGIGTANTGTNRLQVMAGVNTQPLFVGSDSGSVCTMNRDNTDGHVLRFEKNGVLVGHISTNSNSLPSDRNFKRNITDLKLGLDFVNKLKPSVYNYKIDDENCPVHYGLIAQDVESALEECGVEKNSSLMLQHSPTEKEEESDYSLDYGKLVPVLTKAIQEQQQIIEDLQSQNASLESRISALES